MRTSLPARGLASGTHVRERHSCAAWVVPLLISQVSHTHMEQMLTTETQWAWLLLVTIMPLSFSKSQSPSRVHFKANRRILVLDTVIACLLSLYLCRFSVFFHAFSFLFFYSKPSHMVAIPNPRTKPNKKLSELAKILFYLWVFLIFLYICKEHWNSFPQLLVRVCNWKKVKY